MSRSSSMMGIVTVLATLIGWSSVPLFIVHFSRSIDAWTSNGWRYAISAVMWAPLLVVLAARSRMPAGLWRAALIPAVFNALGQGAFAWAFYNLDPATVTFGLRLQIVFVALGAFVMFPGERAVLRSPWALLGLALLLGGGIGTLLLAGEGNLARGAVGVSSDRLLGGVLSVGSGLLFAAYALSVRRCMHAFPSVTSFAAISQYTSLLLVLAMLVLARDPATGEPDLGASALNLGAWPMALLALSSVIGIGLGHVFYYISIARLGVAVSSGVMQLQPFCVALAQLAIFDKRLTGGQWAAGLVAVAGAALLLGVQWRVGRRQAVREGR
jgi:drug/metabolite transporter (DMT)-like permease